MNTSPEDVIGKLLADAFDIYNKNKGGEGNIELELRFKGITHDIFESVYNNVRKDKEFINHNLECSVNIISENIYEQKESSTSYIRKIIFINGKATSDTYYEKTRLIKAINFNEFLKYSLTINKESPCKKFNTSTNALVRFKLRISFEFNDWRFDLTAVKHGNISQISDMKYIRDKLFPASLSVDNIFKELDFALIDSYEIELEYIGNSPSVEDLKISGKLFSLIDANYLKESEYQNEIYDIAKYIVPDNMLQIFKNPVNRLKKLANQVITLNAITYSHDIYPPVDYYLTDKADGQRAIIDCNKGTCYIIKSDDLLTINKETGNESRTIVDAEIIDNVAHIFDVIMIEDKNMANEDFIIRLSEIDKATAIVNKYYTSLPKQFKKLTKDNLEQSIKSTWNAKYSYKLDGLILTKGGSYYQTKNYKWKPSEHMTIDFMAVKCPNTIIGNKPYIKKDGMDLYLLFVGISYTMMKQLSLDNKLSNKVLNIKTGGNYFPILFMPSYNPLAYLYYHPDNDNIDRKIVELVQINNEWKFVGTRDDRKAEKNYFGNDFKVAELTYINYINPFPLENLYKPVDSYFSKVSDNIYMASNRYKRYVISTLLKDNLSNVSWVIDLASGKGGDLHRYQEIGIKDALFIDIDSAAIANLIQRKFAYFNERKSNQTEFLTVHTMVADLKTKYKELIEKIYVYGIDPQQCDGIVCNFALHYMCDSLTNIRNILSFVSAMLKVGGIFMFTVFDGQSIFDLLKDIPHDHIYEVKEDGVMKYAIRKLYTSTKLETCNQMISVKLPMSDEMYDEPLCNIDAIIKESEKLGMNLEINNNMNRLFNKFEVDFPNIYKNLTEDDKKYIGLHKCITLRKVKNISKLV